MSGGPVSAGVLRGGHVGPVAGLWGLVFGSAPRCAGGGLSEGSYEVPVHPFVSGCLTASVAGGHLG